MTAEAIFVSAVFVLLMVAASLRVARRLPEGPVPIHFNIRGKPDRFGSRWVALGILPATYPLLGIALAVGAWISGPEARGEPDQELAGALIAGGSILTAHLFILWLLLRWARAS